MYLPPILRYSEKLIENRDNSLAFYAPVRGGGGFRRNIAITFGAAKTTVQWLVYSTLDSEKNDDILSRFNRIPACDGQTRILRRHSPRYA